MQYNRIFVPLNKLNDLSLHSKIIKRSLPGTIAAAAAVIIGGLYWTGMEPIRESVLTQRMFLLFMSGLAAFITPFLLFPDKRTGLLQLGNISGRTMNRYILSRSGKLFYLPLLLVFAFCFGEINSPLADLKLKAQYFLQGAITLLGLWLLATGRYLNSGESSQFWKESEKGRLLRKQAAEYLKYPVDPGSLPSLLNTILITFAGMFTVAVGAALSQSGGVWMELIPATILLIIGFASFQKAVKNPEARFYRTNAFFSEFFGETVSGAEARVPVTVNQLWWVPARIKSTVWAMLLQLDRKLPAGRLILAGHLLVWIISYQRPGTEVMLTVWMLFALIHHSILFISLSEEFAPNWWRKWAASGLNWMISRFWMQFRWILMLAASMWVNGFVFGHTGLPELIFVTAVYTLSALFFSIALSLFLRFRKTDIYD